jgi:uncharacterized membrane protein YebE (DUF533 family)
MNAREFLNQLLQSGQQMAQRGKEMAEKGLSIPESGPERDQALANLGKGAAAGGLLALLVGTRAGRRLAGPLLKIGGVAAIGAVGYAAYKKWQANQPGDATPPGKPISELAGHESEQRSVNLVRAMIAAARADGHVDQREHDMIVGRIAGSELPDTERRLLQGEMDHALTAQDVAALADSRSAAAEIYLTSLLVIDTDNEMERQYLNELATALDLPWDLVRQLEAEAAAH